MKVHLKKVYYKNVRKGKEPCKFVAKQPKGIGTDIYATVKLDPILRKKKLKPIKDAMVRHEVNEIKVWGKGETAPHRKANSKEPYSTRVVLKGTKGFWRHVEKVDRK
jgi:hypothetical protein